MNLRPTITTSRLCQVAARGLLRAVAVVCAVCGWGGWSAQAGSLSCASVACHGGDDDDAWRTSAGRNEYTRWLNHDPHAQSAFTLQSERFQSILSAVARKPEDRPAVYSRCAQCHDPQGIASCGNDLVRLANLDAPQVTRGIGCESCHGPSKKWLTVHYKRGISREQLQQLGMKDTKNVLERGRQCVGCHVGGPDQDMNHDMIAAGHPPLRFELSAYHDKIARKHWSDRERIETPHFKAQLWAAGQAAATEATLALLESRAARAAAHDKLTPWPEFAEYDCFACHQRLRPAPGSTVALKTTTAGMPGWQPWNLALAEPLASGTTQKAISDLRAALAASLFPDPVQIRDLAAQRDRPQPPVQDFTATQLLGMVESQIRADQSWAASCQQLLALQAAYLSWRDASRSHLPKLVFTPASQHSRFPVPVQEEESAFHNEFDSACHVLRFGSTEVEWPAGDGVQGQAAALRALKALQPLIQSSRVESH